MTYNVFSGMLNPTHSSMTHAKCNEFLMIKRYASLRLVYCAECVCSEAVRTQLVTHDRTIGFHDVRLAELDLRVQCAETTNYDGVLIWKIIEYQRRKREAVSGDVPSTTAPCAHPEL